MTGLLKPKASKRMLLVDSNIRQYCLRRVIGSYQQEVRVWNVARLGAIWTTTYQILAITEFMTDRREATWNFGTKEYH